jgi:hypothetical protein
MPRKGPESSTSPRRVQAALRQAQAMELRVTGMSHAEIAHQLGYGSESSVRTALTTALKHHGAPEAAQLRLVQDARMDALLRAVWEKATTGDLGAVHAAIKVEDFRARLWGTYAFQRNEVIIRQEAQRMADTFGVPVEQILREVNEIMQEGH